MSVTECEEDDTLASGDREDMSGRCQANMSTATMTAAAMIRIVLKRAITRYRNDNRRTSARKVLLK